MIAMADVASIFHWSKDSLEDLTIPDLLEWRSLARERAAR